MPYADPQKRKEYNAALYLAHREERLARQREWYRVNLEKAQAYRIRTKARRSAQHAAWVDKNRVSHNASRRVYWQENRENRASGLRENPTIRVLANLRRRVSGAIHGGYKSDRTQQLIGCEPLELTAWLEGWFSEGMTWENYGSVWHIDHNRPCASFDLTKDEEQRRCFSYLNLRPLFAKDNASKGAKYPYLKEIL